MNLLRYAGYSVIATRENYYLVDSNLNYDDKVSVEIGIHTDGDRIQISDDALAVKYTTWKGMVIPVDDLKKAAKARWLDLDGLAIVKYVFHNDHDVVQAAIFEVALASLIAASMARHASDKDTISQELS